MEIKKVQISGDKVTGVADAYPVKELDNHLIVVRVGYNGWMPSEEDIEEYYEMISDSDVLDQLEDASFMIVSHDVNIETYKPTDFKPMKNISLWGRFKRAWQAFRGY